MFLRSNRLIININLKNTNLLELVIISIQIFYDDLSLHGLIDTPVAVSSPLTINSYY